MRSDICFILLDNSYGLGRSGEHEKIMFLPPMHNSIDLTWHVISK